MNKHLFFKCFFIKKRETTGFFKIRKFKLSYQHYRCFSLCVFYNNALKKRLEFRQF